MQIFLSGATGYIGRFVARALHRAGHRVIGLARAPQRTEPLRELPISWIFGDLKAPDGYAAPAADCDGLIHLGAEGGPSQAQVDRLALAALLEAALGAGAPRVVLYTSGIWVLGASGEQAADEQASVARPAPRVSWRPEHERIALHAARGPVSTAIVRPGVVYGGKGGLTESWFAAAAAGEPPTVIGDGLNCWPTVHGEDLADFYLRLLEQGQAAALRGRPPADRIFHAIGHRGEHVGDMARAVAKAAGIELPIRFQPLESARERIGSLADALALDQLVIGPRSEAALGWRPRYRSLAGNAAELLTQWRRDP
jgi:nucleoside-diphosphate-sugar epimerase